MSTKLTVGAMLKIKGPIQHVTKPDATVLSALRILADKNIGMLAVMDGIRLVGVFSERDYARKVIDLEDASVKAMLVRDLMSSPPITVTPHTTAHACMKLMTDRHIRHLPVLDQDMLVGVISLGDVVKMIMAEQSSIIDEMKSYIIHKRMQEMGRLKDAATQ